MRFTRNMREREREREYGFYVYVRYELELKRRISFNISVWYQIPKKCFVMVNTAKF